jgi:predicted lipoprotein with Yx(FWY)xxD motif
MEWLRGIVRVGRARRPARVSRAKVMLLGIATALGVAGIAAPAAAQAMPTLRATQNNALGPFVTDAQGRTLYEFRRDTGTTSACVDACLTTWPPLVVASGQPTLAPGLGGAVGIAVQADGRRQVTYDGKLLYYYRTDMGPGDANGQAVGGVWFVVAPIAAPGLPRTGGGTPPALAWALPLAGLAGLAGTALRRRHR